MGAYHRNIQCSGIGFLNSVAELKDVVFSTFLLEQEIKKIENEIIINQVFINEIVL